MIQRLVLLLIPLLNVISRDIPYEVFKTYLFGLIQESRYFSVYGMAQKTSKGLMKVYEILQYTIQWQSILYTFAKPLLANGTWYLVVDASPLTQEYAENRITKSGFVSIQGMKNVPQNQVISLILTNGITQLVLDFRIWVSPKVAKPYHYRKQTDLTLDMIKYSHLKGLPVKTILFDSFFASKEIIVWLNENGYQWVTRLKGNRILYRDRKPFRADQLNLEHGQSTTAELKGIDGAVKIMSIPYQDETVFAATNNAELSDAELEACYRLRWKVEEYHREAKQQVGLEYLRMQNYKSLKKSRRLCLPGLQHAVRTTACSRANYRRG
jgi:hypothetical protein